MIQFIFQQASTYVPAVPLISGFFLFRKLALPLKILVFFILGTMVLEVITVLLGRANINNLLVFHAFTYFEFFIIIWIYWKILPLERRPALIKLAILFVFLSLVFSFLWEPFSVFNSFQRFLESALLMVVFYMYYFELGESKRHIYIEWHPYFVLTNGWVFYFLGTSFMFLTAELLFQDNVGAYWIIHSVLNIFLNGIYTFAIWKASKLSWLS